jgi:hypothetical protein
MFSSPHSIAVDPDGKVYVVDTGNQRRVQKFELADDGGKNVFLPVVVR